MASWNASLDLHRATAEAMGYTQTGSSAAHFLIIPPEQAPPIVWAPLESHPDALELARTVGLVLDVAHLQVRQTTSGKVYRMASASRMHVRQSIAVAAAASVPWYAERYAAELEPWVVPIRHSPV